MSNDEIKNNIVWEKWVVIDAPPRPFYRPDNPILTKEEVLNETIQKETDNS